MPLNPFGPPGAALSGAACQYEELEGTCRCQLGGHRGEHQSRWMRQRSDSTTWPAAHDRALVQAGRCESNPESPSLGLSCHHLSQVTKTQPVPEPAWILQADRPSGQPVREPSPSGRTYDCAGLAVLHHQCSSPDEPLWHTNRALGRPDWRRPGCGPQHGCLQQAQVSAWPSACCCSLGPASGKQAQPVGSQLLGDLTRGWVAGGAASAQAALLTAVSASSLAPLCMLCSQWRHGCATQAVPTLLPLPLEARFAEQLATPELTC